jgi:hypothetical protein
MLDVMLVAYSMVHHLDVTCSLLGLDDFPAFLIVLLLARNDTTMASTAARTANNTI